MHQSSRAKRQSHTSGEKERENEQPEQTPTYSYNKWQPLFHLKSARRYVVRLRRLVYRIFRVHRNFYDSHDFDVNHFDMIKSHRFFLCLNYCRVRWVLVVRIMSLANEITFCGTLGRKQQPKLVKVSGCYLFMTMRQEFSMSFH